MCDIPAEQPARETSRPPAWGTGTRNVALPKVLTIEIQDEVLTALDRMVDDLDAGSREMGVTVGLREWLIDAGYMPSDFMEDDDALT